MMNFQRIKKFWLIAVVFVAVCVLGACGLAQGRNYQQLSQIQQGQMTTEGTKVSDTSVTFGLDADETGYELVSVGKDVSGEFVVPDEHEGLPVTTIGFQAFAECKLLTSVQISEGIEVIQPQAFEWCSGIKSVTIPESVERIGYGAFSACESLETVNIPSGVTSIESSTFEYCFSLSEIEIPENITRIGDYAFFCCYNLSSLDIPESVTKIGKYAFAECSSLMNFVVPTSVTRIPEAMLLGCSKIEEIDIHDDVTEIGPNAFRGCTKLAVIFIPRSVTLIDAETPKKSPFWGCGEGLTICVEATQEEILDQDGEYRYGPYWNYVSDNVVGITVFGMTREDYEKWLECFAVLKFVPNEDGETCTVLCDDSPDLVELVKRVSFVIIPEKSPSGLVVTHIAENGFARCENLTSLILSSDVQIVGEGAFHSSLYSCVDLTIYKGHSEWSNYIADELFADKIAIENVTILDGITHIGDFAFQNCELTSMTIPCCVETWDTYHHGDDVLRLSELTITKSSLSSSVKSYGYFLEYGSDDSGEIYIDGAAINFDIDKIIIGEGITSIDDQAFEGFLELVEIQIPESVISIGEYAFSNCRALQSIDLPDNITCISPHMFEGCAELESIDFLSTATSIGEYAFAGCKSLTSIEIPSHIESIGEFFILGCSGLESIIIDPQNSTFDSRDNSNAIIETQTNTLIAGCKNTVIKNSVEAIGACAFYEISSLENVDLSENIKSIGEMAFYGCSGIKSITIPSKVTTIENQTFYGCSGIESITILSGVTTIEECAFYECSGIKILEIPETVVTIEERAFHGCSGIEVLEIPQHITSIGYESFYGCSGLKKITYPNIFSEDFRFVECFSGYGLHDVTIKPGTSTIITIDSLDANCIVNLILCEGITEIAREIVYDFDDNGEEYEYEIIIFEYSDILQSISIPNSIESIGVGEFLGCSALKNVEMPNIVTNFSSYFSDYSDLNVTIRPAASTEIAISCFAKCDLGDVVLCEGITNIRYNAFYDSEITSISIPSTVSSIGSSAFQYCDNLISVDVPEGVTSISDQAFYNNINLEQLTLPSSLDYIGDKIVHACWKLEDLVIASGNEIYDSRDNCNAIIETETNTLLWACKGSTIPSTVTAIGDDAFNSCLITSITIPDSVITIGSQAFQYCYDLTSITIPNSVTTIGSSAFAYCLELTSITISSSVTSIGTCAFGYCSKINNIVVDSSNTIFKSDNNTLINKSSNTLVVASNRTTSIPTYVREIAMYAFSRRTISSITIPNSVITIGRYAFEDCDNLSTITIPSSVTSIGIGAFADCSGIDSITVDSTNSKYADLGCNVIIETSTNTLIAGSNNTTRIPSSVKIIADDAFSERNIYSIIIPQGVTSIGDDAFFDCDLTNIDIPDTVESIGGYAFASCGLLRSVYIPESVVYMGAAVFRSISSIIYVNSSANTSNWSENWNLYAYLTNGDVIRNTVEYVDSREEYESLVAASSSSSNLTPESDMMTGNLPSGGVDYVMLVATMAMAVACFVSVSITVSTIKKKKSKK